MKMRENNFSFKKAFGISLNRVESFIYHIAVHVVVLMVTAEGSGTSSIL
jgi:hypothetical protein